MSQEPHGVSIPSSTPLSPDEIARKAFPAARKGLDGEAVRTFLAKVAAELHGALEREATLRERLAEAERRAAEPELDEATLARAIGIETAKILSTAHEAARNVVTKAEERAAELIAEAEQVLARQVAVSEAEASAIRAAAEEEVAEYAGRAEEEADSLTAVAHAEAVELLDATKQECRRMVSEARGLRNRTLAELVERRRALRVQLEELRTGKDSLLSVVDAVGVSVEELRGRLASAEDQARVSAAEAGRRVADVPGPDDFGELEVELSTARAGVADGEPAGPDEVASGFASAGEGEAGGALGVVAGAMPAEEEYAGGGQDQNGSSASRRSVDELFARIRASRAAEEAAAAPAAPEPVASEAEQAAEPVETAPEAVQTVGLVSEALMEAAGVEGKTGAVHEEREETAEIVVVGADSETVEATEAAVRTVASREAGAITEPDAECLARRDHLLAPITAKLGRALKRALQDDQNDLLNALRQTSRKPVLDELVPADLQRERFIAAASDPLAKAYEAGAGYLVVGDSVQGPSVSAPVPSETVASEAGVALAGELANELSGVLRQRTEEAFSELDASLEGAQDAAGIAYREWKGPRVEGLAGDFTTRAFAVGELAVLDSLDQAAAPLVRWAVEDDDGGGSCPDCYDNSLAGPQEPGVAFPTGHSHPPVHPGCRCLLVTVRS